MVFLSVWGKKVKIDWKKRVLSLVVTAIVSVYFSGLVLNNVNVQNKLGFRYSPFTTVSDNLFNGVLMTLAYHNTLNTMKPPDGYSEEAALDILAQVGEMPEPILSGGEKPDVIIILNESFCDLQSIADFETDIDVLPFFRSLSGDNLVKKNIYVSTKGGGTPNSETEILTGCSMSFFPLDSYPYIQFFDSEVTGLPLYLTQMGYRAIAMHPFSPEGWNRNEVFPFMGFSEFYSLRDFGEAQIIRDFVSDEAAYEFLINKYEEHKANDPETPLLEYLITMQNHGGYNLKKNLPEKVEILTAEEYPEGEQFVSLIRVSDQALEGLIEYFEEVEDPVVIIFFGDHQPSFADGFSEYMSENLIMEAIDPVLPFYVVPLLVWANYDISESALAQSEISCFGANYVSALLADIIGVEDAPFLAFLLDHYKEIPMINSLEIIDAQNNVYLRGDKNYPAEIEKYVKQYEILQYYYLS
jgi:phosphoglycerol transferase MdoB-like AlkP superfamily enzyme